MAVVGVVIYFCRMRGYNRKPPSTNPGYLSQSGLITASCKPLLVSQSTLSSDLSYGLGKLHHLQVSLDATPA